MKRAEDETEAAFRQRMAVQSAIVFAGAKYGGPAINQPDGDLRL